MNRQNIIELMLSQVGQQALRSALHLPKSMLGSISSVAIQKFNKDTVSGEEIQSDTSKKLFEDSSYKRIHFSEHALKLNENRTSQLITPLRDDVRHRVYGLIESGIER